MHLCDLVLVEQHVGDALVDGEAAARLGADERALRHVHVQQQLVCQPQERIVPLARLGLPVRGILILRDRSIVHQQNVHANPESLSLPYLLGRGGQLLRVLLQVQALGALLERGPLHLGQQTLDELCDYIVCARSASEIKSREAGRA